MKRRYMVLLVTVLALAVAFFYISNPMRHTKTFVALYSGRIEESVVAGDGVPENLGCLEVSTWEAAKDKETGAVTVPMTEFILSGWGIGSNIRYYGCYYSPQDVPLPFRNAPLKLTQNGHDYWTWTGEGDNHGSTQKIKDCWYYFEASF